MLLSPMLSTFRQFIVEVFNFRVREFKGACFITGHRGGGGEHEKQDVQNNRKIRE